VALAAVALPSPPVRFLASILSCYLPLCPFQYPPSRAVSGVAVRKKCLQMGAGAGRIGGWVESMRASLVASTRRVQGLLHERYVVDLLPQRWQGVTSRFYHPREIASSSIIFTDLARQSQIILTLFFMKRNLAA
jgi:hypothetical protein